MKRCYTGGGLRERLLHFERRYGLSSEGFIRLYEGHVKFASQWVYLTVPKYGLCAVKADDAFVWAGLCHRLGIGGGD
jgi:hypothetical protein